MRVYHRETQQGVSTGGGAAVWTNPVPTATVIVRAVGGAAIQALTAAYSAVRARLYFDTANAFYANNTLYQADLTITIGATAYTTTDYYVHYTPTTST